jgi:hypothetical protein
MTTKEFELKLKELDENFNIRKCNVPDIESIYYLDTFIGRTIPANNIYEDVRPDYKDDTGRVHRTVGEALELAKHWLTMKDEELELDREFKELQSQKYAPTEKQIKDFVSRQTV